MKAVRKVLAGLALGAMLLPAGASAAEKNISDWLTIGGDYRFRVDSLRAEAPAYMQLTPTGGVSMPETVVKNDSLYTNRFGLNLKAKVMQNVTFNGRLLMYKSFGSQDSTGTSGTYFADRVGVFDGTLGHVPSDGQVTVDQAYVTINNILDQPIWFSVGRRPSTGGLPTHIRQNNDKPGVGGINGLLVDYAYDGMTLGYAPDIDALPGAYAKLCYGRGFEGGFKKGSAAGVRDMDMLGFVVVPYDTDRLSIHLEANRGMNVIDFPTMKGTALGIDTAPSTNLGDIDQFGAAVMSTLKNVGPGVLNLFGSGGMSVTRPNGNTTNGIFGMMNTDADFNPGNGYQGDPKHSRTGWAAYAGVRYDLPSKTKIGFEYNHGSKGWISFIPAGDDIWTSKLGTRGDVYEGYVIQELPYAPISSEKAKTFVRVGYQYSKFDFTGSNNWVGAPTAMGDVASTPQMLTPIKNAQDLYATLEVKF